MNMLYLEKESAPLNLELFRNPTVDYRSVPFWSWNCRVSEQEISRQLDVFQQMGFGGVDIHPRTGLDTEYLGEEYLRLVRFTVEQCKEKGLRCWLYDDDRFPSGAADGLVTREPRFRQRCLLLTETARPDFLPSEAEFNAAMAGGEAPGGWLAAIYAVGDQGVRRLAAKEEPRQGERRRYGYVMLLEPEEWFQGQTYVDVMNPVAIRRFIEVTHETYFREVGADFGGTVPAIFTDEPRMETRTNRHPKRLENNQSREEVILPWSDELRNRLLWEKGLDILDMAPALVYDLPESPEMRYHFRNAASEQFVSSFLDQIGDWCRAHGILMTGHVLGEDTLSSQAASLGDCMRCYRGMDLPGVDVLCDDRQYLAVKQAASVAHQNGKAGVVSELYGVTEWNCDWKTFKLQGDWQAALGVTARVPHLSWMSMEGEAKRDWPGSIFDQAPWWQEFHTLEDYFARLNTVLTRGKPLIDVAVIHPVESMWMQLGTNEGTAKNQKKMDARFNQLVEDLLLHLVDFDLISESLLPDQHPSCSERKLHVGEMAYRVVAVPDMDTIRSSTLNLLEQFADKGGRIVFTGRIPDRVDAVPSKRAAKLAERCTLVRSREELFELLKCEQRFLIQEGNHSADNLLAQLRQERNAYWLFLCHAKAKEAEKDDWEKYQIQVRGNYEVTRFHPETGEISSVDAPWDGQNTLISWEAGSEDSLLLRFAPAQAGSTKGNDQETAPSYRPVHSFISPAEVSLNESNPLLLDYARGQIGYGEMTEKMEILRLDDWIRSQLGLRRRYGAMMQPYAMEEGKAYPLTLYYEILSETKTSCQLAMEHPEKCRIFFNGELVEYEDQGWYVDRAIRRIRLPDIKEGVNRLQIRMDFHQKTNLENLFLLGNFDVEKQPGGNSVVTTKKRKSFGDITSQGLPFYSGILRYRMPFTLTETGNFRVWVPHFQAALLKVALDGTPKGQIAFSPYRLALGQLKADVHLLEIDAYLGRHNGFGYLHNCDEDFRWFGPDAWRTTGNQWTDDYQLKPAGILSQVVLEKQGSDR